VKIAVSAQNPGWSASLDERFGRAAWFVIVDDETKQWQAVENMQNRQSAQGAGIQAAATLQELHIPAGVVVNRCDLGNDELLIFCRQQNLPILAEIPLYRRLAELMALFRIPAWVCVNKWDLDPEMSLEIEEAARAMGMSVAGRISFDLTTVRAQLQGRPVIDYPDSVAAVEIKEVWNRLQTAPG